MTIWKKHIFTAELPYEKDAVVTLFLRDRFDRVDDFIMSLGQMSNIPPSRLLTYKNGKLASERTYAKNNLNAAGIKLYFLLIPKSLLFVMIDLIRALKVINFTCDIFFAQHFMPAFIAIILRRLGILKCKKIVFWMFDFFLIPPQFTRGLYYRGVDYIQDYVRRNLDEIWYSTPRLAECDQERFGKLPSSVAERITNGLFMRRIKTPKPPSVPPLKLAFLGSLRRNNAIYESVDTIASCIEHKMKVELHVIGSGPEEGRLKKYVKKRKVAKAVKLYGFEDRGEKIARIFSKCHLGMCLYPADPYGPNWHLTSGKFRRFIAQGLPVVVSTVPYFVKYIHDYKAGLIVDNEPDEVRKALQKIYKDPSRLNSLRRGVDKLYRDYQADKVLKEAFDQLIK
jgi:glycosyltransferase involved in cell wall biosynthesis